MQEKHKRQGRKLFSPLVRLLATLRVSPNAVTLAALPFSLASAGLFALGHFVWAGVALALGGLCDLLDGELSRLTGRQSRTGALLDSTVDRLCEAAVFMGLGWYYRENPWLVLLAVAAMVFSLMVSYVRARAEGLGHDCAVGWFERPVRLVLMLLGAFVLGPTWLPVVLGIVVLGSAITVGQRLAHVFRQRPGGSS